jgi:putative acetyltransferase
MPIANNIKIRQEQSKDIIAIREINSRAFDGPGEAALVDLLRSNNKAKISLVALWNERLVGHILFSPVTFDPPNPGLSCVGLAPMAVLPELQNQGIGSYLVKAGINTCQTLKYDAAFVLGHVNFYPRFGFQPASQHNLDCEYDAGPAFMALELKPGVLSQVWGSVIFAAEFNQVGP